MTPHLLIIGCGDLGVRVGTHLNAEGWRISALRRSIAALPEIFKAYEGDYTDKRALQVVTKLNPDFVFFTPLPQGRDVVGYQRGFHDPVQIMTGLGLLDSVTGCVMVSSTRVYAEAKGGWVDEASSLTKTDPLAHAIIEGERCALAGACRTTILRASGIYGAQPGMLLERLRKGLVSAEPNRFSNRIHRDDLAGIAAQVFLTMARGQLTPPIMNVSDDEPAPLGDVENWLLNQLHLSVEGRVGTAAASASIRGNRRCSNGLLRREGYSLRYPTYREGYSAMLAGG